MEPVMFNIILYEPEIPPNTGNIIRLCANTGTTLSLIQPLGFTLDEPKLRRAGLDYTEVANITKYPDLDSCLDKLQLPRVFAFSTKGSRSYASVQYMAGDAFLFGPETRGLPTDVLEKFRLRQRVRIPMQNNSRSLNLSNAVAVVNYEAWRQNDFGGCA